MTVEADVITVLDICRVLPSLPSSEALHWASGLSHQRLWVAGKVISNSGLIGPPGPGGMVWPSNDAVLACHRAGEPE